MQGFTRHGYSVGWTISHFKTYGLPQPRKRLIMFGSCPGEKLPPFPKPTHGDPRRGLRPYVTARDVLSFLRPGMYLHDPRSTVPRDQAPWNPDEPLPWTITCDGGRNTFWDGKRTLTLRELAILQGFARDHKFQEPSIKKQIGNAFPSAVVKVFYAHLVAWLDEQDGIDPARAARQRARVFRDGARSGHRGDGSASSPIELV